MNKNPELAIRIGVDAKDSIAILRKLDAQYTGLVKSLKGQIGKVGALQSLEQVTDASDAQKKKMAALRAELQAIGLA